MFASAVAVFLCQACGTRITSIKNRLISSEAVVTTPVILSITPPAPGTYGTGAALVFQLHFSEAVRTTPGTHLFFDVGGIQRTLLYSAGSGTTTLVYTYLVLSGEVDPNGIALGPSLELGIGTVQSLVGKAAELALPVIDTTTVLVNAFQPSVTLASVTSAATNSSPIPVTVTFSAAVTGFTAADIVVAGGTLSGFAGSGAAYTFNFTPSGEGTLTANVSAGVAQDVSANGNAAAPTFTRIYDITAPLAGTGTGWAETSPHAATTVTANWTASTSTDAATQRIQYYADATCSATSGAAVTLALPSTASHSFTGVDGGIYTFRITTLDAAGNSATTACSPSMRLDLTAPAAANSLAWSETSPHSLNSTVTANWTKSAATDLAIQRVQFFNDATCTAAFGAAINLGSTTLETRALTAANGTYTFRIASVDTAGNSSTSACSAAIVISPTALTNRGLLARYFFEEATSGRAVATAREARSSSPVLDLNLYYHDTRINYASAATGSALEFTDGAGNGDQVASLPTGGGSIQTAPPGLLEVLDRSGCGSFLLPRRL